MWRRPPAGQGQNHRLSSFPGEGWGLPSGWPAGWGWAQVRSLFPFPILPVSITELLHCRDPLPVLPLTQGVLTLSGELKARPRPALGKEAVSSPASEVCKQMQE